MACDADKNTYTMGKKIRVVPGRLQGVLRDPHDSFYIGSFQLVVKVSLGTRTQNSYFASRFQTGIASLPVVKIFFSV